MSTNVAEVLGFVIGGFVGVVAFYVLMKRAKIAYHYTTALEWCSGVMISALLPAFSASFAAGYVTRTYGAASGVIAVVCLPAAVVVFYALCASALVVTFSLVALFFAGSVALLDWTIDFGSRLLVALCHRTSHRPEHKSGS